jgi:hypothetical protein
VSPGPGGSPTSVSTTPPARASSNALTGLGP